MKVPTSFVVSLQRASARRLRMMERFTRQGLPFTLVDAVDTADAGEELRRYRPETNPTAQERAVAACFASHLRALRAGLATGEDEFIIIEDDVRLVLNFRERFEKLRANIPPTTPLTSLSYLVWRWDGFLWNGLDVAKENLTTMGPDLWGTQMYLITRKWAAHSIEKFDHPLPEIATDDIRTSELIVRSASREGGLVAYPPLGIEELSGSLIVPEAGNANHGSGLHWWNVATYDA